MESGRAVVLTGATGFVGSVVLDRLLARPDVRLVTCLTRRRLPRPDHPRLASVVVDDFTRHDPARLRALAAADACIWALGAKSSDVADPAAYERVTHAFTLALARGIAEHADDHTFCYLSGWGADPGARLPWQRRTRQLKGRTEGDLRALARPGFRVRAVRPAGVLPATTGRVVRRLLAPVGVAVDVLADVLVEVAIGGRPGLPDVVTHRGVHRLARGPR